MPDLVALARENLDFLRRSSWAYDEGDVPEAKRLAVTLRVLLHDTKQSHSLLGQLGVKDSLRWYDTAVPIHPDNLLPTPGLIQMQMEPGVGVTYTAPLDDRPPELMQPPSGFTPWWNNAVCKLPDRTWSRSQLVLVLANQEGGAHVDPNLNDAYESLARQNALGFSYVDERGGRPAEGNPVAVAVRQIAHEVLKTCEGQLASLLPE